MARKLLPASEVRLDNFPRQLFAQIISLQKIAQPSPPNSHPEKFPIQEIPSRRQLSFIVLSGKRELSEGHFVGRGRGL